MNELISEEEIKIENMIFEIRGKQVMLDSELFATKWHDYLIDKIITHYDIGKQISIWRCRKEDVMIEEIDKTYNAAIYDIKQDINKTQLDIMINANISLVNLYYRIGKVLYDNSVWGNKFLDKLAFELKNSYPN